jgi:AraC-like DNA-binding protein
MEPASFLANMAALHRAPQKGQIRISQLSGLTGLLSAAGSASTLYLRRFGLTEDDLAERDGYIERQTVIDLLEYCSVEARLPALGMLLGSRQDADVYGAIAALFRSAPTLGEALSSKCRYLEIVHTPDCRLEIARAGDRAELRWHIDDDSPENRQAHLQALFLNVRMIGSGVGEPLRPIAVALTSKLGDAAKDLAQSALGCPIHTGSDANAILFPSAWLDRPMIDADGLVFDLLSEGLDLILANARASLRERTARYIGESIAASECSLVECARALGFASFRTFQERLDAEGVTFSQILHEQRLVLAKRYLEQGELSLKTISGALGYSEQAAFGRAFSRWMGVTPDAYRKRFRT